MSSDYGSDILSDDIAAIDDPQSHAAAPPATPRQPLELRDANVLVTPPPSQCRKDAEMLNVSSKQPRPGVWLSHGDWGIALPSSIAPKYNAPSSSQPLPTPLSMRPVPSCSHPPPSSQPTPSRRPIESKSPKAPSTRKATQCETTFTQPTPYRENKEHPLYRFPFGAHKGKTLLEVPDNYIAYLHVDQAMAESMPGLADVMRLYDADLPPVVLPPPSLPPSSSQPVSREPPSSTAPARLTASQPAMSPKSSTPPSSSQTQYRFDFGKHIGKTLAEVPADYIRFLKQRGIAENKPTLAVALIKHEREQSRAQTSQSAPASYTLTFGKHRGKTLDEVPADYLTWLRTSDVCLEKPDLRDALAKYEYLQPAKSSKRKRTSQTISAYTSLGTFGTRRYAAKKMRRR